MGDAIGAHSLSHTRCTIPHAIHRHAIHRHRRVNNNATYIHMHSTDTTCESKAKIHTHAIHGTMFFFATETIRAYKNQSKVRQQPTSKETCSFNTQNNRNQKQQKNTPKRGKRNHFWPTKKQSETTFGIQKTKVKPLLAYKNQK